MARRTYNQFCGLSRSLDIVGERWTLLIVRELMSGPKRYTDLAERLDGIGTSLLASRLRQLEDDGVVRRAELPPPAASLVYQLTPSGKDLAAAMMPLALWGLRHHLGATRAPDQAFRAEWTLGFVAQLIDPQAAAGVRATYEFHIEDSVAQLVVDDGRVTVTPGLAVDGADVTVTVDLPTVVDIALGRFDPASALRDGKAAATGDPEAVRTLLRLVPQVTPLTSDAGA